MGMFPDQVLICYPSPPVPSSTPDKERLRPEGLLLDTSLRAGRPYPPVSLGCCCSRLQAMVVWRWGIWGQGQPCGPRGSLTSPGLKPGTAGPEPELPGLGKCPWGHGWEDPRAMRTRTAVEAGALPLMCMGSSLLPGFQS